MPIIPGLKPITTLKHINFLPKTFNIDIPEALADELEKCKNNDQVEKVGIEWGIEQCKELVASGIPVLHFYTMGKSKAVKEICKSIF